MTVFWVAAAVMLVAGLAWVLPALWQRPDGADPSHDEHAMQAYESRLTELEEDHRDGLIDTDQLSAARDDLARELLRDVRDERPPRDSTGAATISAIAVALLVCAASVGLYQTLGTPEGMAVAGPGPSRAQLPGAQPVPVDHPAGDGAAPGSVASVEAMVDGLAERLRSAPDDGEGWMMLGRSYAVLGRLEEARDALARAHALIPDNADNATAYAEVLGFLNDNSLQGRPRELIEQVLAGNATHPKALWLAGIAAMQAGQGAQAARHWQALLGTGELNAEESATLERFIAEARQGNAPGQAGATPGATGTPPSTAMASPATPARGSASAPGASSGSAGADSRGTATAGASTPGADPRGADAATGAAAGIRLSVTVKLAPGLLERVRPDDALFVFARAEQGPPMPLAVQRLRAADLPVTVTLDESMAMMPQFTLATFPRVVVGARISKSGNATPTPGDLQGVTDGLSPADTGQVEVTISEVVGG